MAEHEYYEVNGRQIRVRPTESGMKRIRIRKSTLLILMQIQQSHYSMNTRGEQKNENIIR